MHILPYTCIYAASIAMKYALEIGNYIPTNFLMIKVAMYNKSLHIHFTSFLGKTNS